MAVVLMDEQVGLTNKSWTSCPVLPSSTVGEVQSVGQPVPVAHAPVQALHKAGGWKKLGQAGCLLGVNIENDAGIS